MARGTEGQSLSIHIDDNNPIHGCMTQRATLQIIIHQAEVMADSVKVIGTIVTVVLNMDGSQASRQGTSGSLKWITPKAHFLKQGILVSYWCKELEE